MPLFTKNNRNILFVHIPKTAGTSIEAAFMDAEYTELFLHVPSRDDPDRAPCNPQHWHHGLVQRWIYPAYKIHSEFAIVRNPFTRCISEFFWRGKPNRGFNDKFYQELQTFIVQNLNKYIENEKLFQTTKESFLKENKKFHADNHWRPQWHFVGKNTQIFKYETLHSKCWPTIKTKYSLTNMHHKNAKIPPDIVRPSRMGIDTSSEFKELYLQVYQKDHTQFGYDLPF